MRLIDGDALGNRMYHESFEKDSDLQRWDGGCWIRYKLFEQVLRAAPTIDLTHPTSSNTNVPDTNVGDLISRQAAIDAVKEYFKFSPLEGRQCAKAIERVPSAQPRMGKWILDNPHSEIYRYACSECYAHHRARYDFCPSCGADMREGEEE